MDWGDWWLEELAQLRIWLLRLSYEVHVEVEVEVEVKVKVEVEVIFEWNRNYDCDQGFGDACE